MRKVLLLAVAMTFLAWPGIAAFINQDDFPGAFIKTGIKSDFSNTFIHSLPKTTTSEGYAPWVSWDESSESTLADDDIFVVLAQNASGGNEQGQGAKQSGDDTIIPCGDFNSSIASWREITPGAYASCTENFTKAWNNTTSFSIIYKFGNFTGTSLADDKVLTWKGQPTWVDGALIAFYTNCSVFARLGNGTDSALMEPSGNLTTTGLSYLVLQYDGTNAMFGYTDTKPNVWSDIPDNQKVSVSLPGPLDINATTSHYFLGEAGSQLSTWWAYTVVANKTLIK